MEDSDTAYEEQQHDYRWKRRYGILYRAEISTLYHRKRERFFSLLDKWEKVVTLFLGSAAFLDLVGQDKHPIFGLFAILSLTSLIFDFSEKSKKHGELAAKFKRLEASIEKVGEYPEEEQINEWSAQLREIESGEPASYNLLVAICQNELANSRGRENEVSQIPFYVSWLANFIPFSNRKIEFKQGASGQ